MAELLIGFGWVLIKYLTVPIAVLFAASIYLQKYLDKKALNKK